MRPRKIGSYNPEIWEKSERVQDERWSLFDPNMDITDAYGLSRSLRRGSTIEAGNRKVDARVVVMKNRWRKFEKAKGRKPSMAMAAHYTEVRLSLPTLWEYSYSF